MLVTRKRSPLVSRIMSSCVSCCGKIFQAEIRRKIISARSLRRKIISLSVFRPQTAQITGNRRTESGNRRLEIVTGLGALILRRFWDFQFSVSAFSAFSAFSGFRFRFCAFPQDVSALVCGRRLAFPFFRRCSSHSASDLLVTVALFL
jgi:hypothetical protein